MRSKLVSLFVLAVFVTQACNLERVLNPSLPTSTPQTPVEVATFTPAPTSLPTALPTLTNEARIEEGDRLLYYGDWEGALRAYQNAFEQSDEVELQSAALLGVGRSYLRMGQFTAARESINTLLQQYPDSSHAAPAYLVLGEVQKEFEDWVAAAEAYQNYLDLRPGVIDAYVQEWRGDALFAAGDYPGAIAAFEAAVVAARLAEAVAPKVKIGRVQEANGDYLAAIEVYQEIYDTTVNDYLKADMGLLIGRAYIELGDTQQAHAFFLHTVNNFPLASSSHAALVELVNAGVTVDELQRGLIDYYAAQVSSGEGAQELHIVAIAAFDRYLQSNPGTHNDVAHYYRALSLSAIGNQQESINEWDHMIENHAFDEHWVDAYSEKAFIQWVYLEDYDGAIATLLSFVAATPSQGASAQFLFDAGRIAERGGRLTRSTEIWPRVAEEYPASEYAYDALFLAGISHFRLENYSDAQGQFVKAYQASLTLEQESQSLFWIAKAMEAQGDDAGARNAWQQAAAVDPTGYYSERARDLLAGVAPFAPVEYSFEYDLEAEKAEAEAWIRSNFGLANEIDLSGPGLLQSDPRFVRGTELWNLGLYELARAEFESLRLDNSTDPANSYRLANYFLELGLYRTAVFAAREVLNLAGMSDAGTMSAPTYFNRIRFGAYYGDLVLPATKSNNLDPLFFYSMMRQESLYEGFVTSSAGARGLLQIIPTTGQEVANLSGWPPDFTPDDLYRPVVSIRLGADYLAIQLNAFDGDLYAALAAYNAGPGWASYWTSLSNGDQDLFLEVINFAETRNHIRSIYELFVIYRNLYSAENQ